MSYELSRGANFWASRTRIKNAINQGEISRDKNQYWLLEQHMKRAVNGPI